MPDRNCEIIRMFQRRTFSFLAARSIMPIRSLTPKTQPPRHAQKTEQMP